MDALKEALKYGDFEAIVREARIDALRDWLPKCESSGRINAIADLLVTRRELHGEVADLDADGMLFNAANGTVDLRTGQTHQHDRRDRLTKFAPVSYDPAATCPTFTRFLEEIQPDPEVRAYLQRHLGHAITGEVDEQTFHIWYGGGANGKSTLVNVVRWIAGEYATTTVAETFMARKMGSSATNDLAALRGVRMCLVPETESGQTLAIGRIKRATGGDELSARFLYKEFFTYTPVFDLIFVTNVLPKIPESTVATERRLVLIPFKVQIPPRQQDQHLLARLKDEGPGILNWLLCGIADWRQGGMRPPEQVLTATRDYADEEDTVGSFLALWGWKEPTARVGAGDLHASYTAWCEQEGEEPVDTRQFRARIAAAGYQQRRDNRGIWWEGLGLQRGAPSPQQGAKNP
jgi:putative DNA primase/helicase